MKKTALTLVALVLFAMADAHEFWLQPKKYRYAVGEEMKIDFMVGENFSGEYWDLTKHKVEKADIHFLGGVTNLTAQVKPTKGNNISYKFLKEGTHLVTLQSNAAYIELE